MPALEIVANFASGAGSDLINHQVLYWGTGMVSGFLDNAPTYLNFLAAALAAQGGSINNIGDVIDFCLWHRAFQRFYYPVDRYFRVCRFFRGNDLYR